MPPFSEKGHAKNIANFQTIINFVQGYGNDYNPSKSSLKTNALAALVLEAQAKLAEVVTQNVNFNNAVNNRILEFSTLKPLATRTINALQVTNAANGVIKDAKTLNRKLQGKRASNPIKTDDPNAPAPNTISSSQQSYDQQVQHFAGIIAILQTEPSYAPNEADLTIVGLTAKLTGLSEKNAAVAAAYTVVSNARILRNNTLYNIETGLVPTALEIKKYVKSIFGSTSPQFNQVKAIEFFNMKI